MTLNDLVETSVHVAATASRLQKTALLADALRRFSAAEREIGVGYLVGILRQGRLGVGPALLARLAQLRGAGMAALHRERLAQLYAHATAAGQAYLTRLLNGELRQGALEGVLIDAIARAANTAVADVRRAVMLAGDIVRSGVEGDSRLQCARPAACRLSREAFEVLRDLRRCCLLRINVAQSALRIDQIQQRRMRQRVGQRGLSLEPARENAEGVGGRHRRLGTPGEPNQPPIKARDELLHARRVVPLTVDADKYAAHLVRLRPEPLQQHRHFMQRHGTDIGAMGIAECNQLPGAARERQSRRATVVVDQYGVHDVARWFD